MSLNRALELAYRGLAMGHADQYSAAHRAIMDLYDKDHSILPQAESELARCMSVSDRCFVSKIHAEFLREAVKAMRLSSSSSHQI